MINTPEQQAAWRIADLLGLENDQRYSLVRHHADQVDRRMAAARRDHAGPRRAPGRPLRHLAAATVPVGWEAWLQNRQVSLRDR